MNTEPRTIDPAIVAGMLAARQSQKRKNYNDFSYEQKMKPIRKERKKKNTQQKISRRKNRK